MGIQIDRVRISGFRGVSNIEITLPRVTLLIGANNAGKTSVIKALQLALGDYARFLADEDFYINDAEKRQEEITVDIRFIPIDAITKQRGMDFTDVWQQEFGDNIQSEADGMQYVVTRTVAKPDKIKGGYLVERYALDKWPTFDKWRDEPVSKKRQLRGRFEAIPFISIDAQRDIHNELKEKTSFIGRVLSSVEYNKDDVKTLEDKVAAINKEAIDKSESLKKLKQHLDSLNHSFDIGGQTELAPFPKKIRDLSKRFSVHFGESENNSFSMEYHGMGTRSWASMLTVKAFVEMMASNHEAQADPFFPIMAAEEPEAHLHPNAQRTLYSQLVDTAGQIIISTHSPYLAAMADIANLRGLIKSNTGVNATALVAGLDPEDIHILQREIMRFRGEILFARAIILFEGVTEEQLIPAMFEAYFGFSAFSVGVTCISVAGKNYPPFVKMAASFAIPVCIVSDNDGTTKHEITAQLVKINKINGLVLNADNFFLSYLHTGNDIEAELIAPLGLRREIVDALVLTETRGSGNEQYIAAKKKEIDALNDVQLLEKMHTSKASYAGFLADVIKRNPYKKNKESLVPEAVRNAFDQIQGWISK